VHHQENGMYTYCEQNNAPVTTAE